MCCNNKMAVTHPHASIAATAAGYATALTL